jgi:cytidyltransferase-like protein
MNKIVLVTGGFDPLHSGHISYLNAARKLGSKLVVGLNSDEWLARKKGYAFLPMEERKAIVEALGMVDYTITFNDDDGTSCAAIEKILSDTDSNVIFANGGDRNNSTTPEYIKHHKDARIDFVFGVGGEDKKNSSSWILDKWKTNKTERDWGYWRVLDDKGIVKVKELVINPNQSLSDQRHFHRSEHWYVLEGEVNIDLQFPNEYGITKTMGQHETFIIKEKWWHKAYNKSDVPCHILEVQYGEKCIEEDIERR